MGVLISIINAAVSILTLLVFVYTLLSFFMQPYHPFRRFLGRLVEPMLEPIRKRVPHSGGFDFSPLILIILIQIIGMILVAIIQSLR